MNPVRVIDMIEDACHSLAVPKDGEDPRPWRKAVRAFLILIVAANLGHFIWAWNGLQYVGVSGPALADDVHELEREILIEVDDRISEAIVPLQEKAESTDRMTRALLRASYRPQIEAKVRERCDTTDARERAAINTELYRLKREYADLAGEPFGEEPTCDQV